ncbi:MAG: S-layer homology domain-containing protein [bacterium]
MNFKKLSLAAAISISILTIGNTAQAVDNNASSQNQSYPSQQTEQNTQQIPMAPGETGGACPVVTTPETSTCPSEQNQENTQMPMIPGMTGGACPTNSPVTATCPNITGGSNYPEKQVYAYPSIAGKNLVIPSGDQIIQIGGEPQNMMTETSQTEAFLNPQGIMTTSAPVMYPTGAAAPIVFSENMPTACPVDAGTSVLRPGAQVLRGPQFQTGAAAPITIQTSSGLQIQRTVLVPVETPTGAAAPIEAHFPDVSSSFWAGNDINKLASAGVIAGYPDRTFKPNLPVLRSELASMLVSGLELENTPIVKHQVFSDVPKNYWANNAIDKAYNAGLIAGYPNDTYHPKNPVSMSEALTVMAKAIPGTLTATQTKEILNSYSDASQVPCWAVIPVAESLNAGLLQGFPNPDQINPNKDATRADIASMLSQLRQHLALEPSVPTTTGAAAALKPQMVTATIPTLNLKFNNYITARASQVGDKFTAKTLEPVTINGMLFPQGSIVNGKIVEVIRPNSNNKGALKVAFTDIQNEEQTAALPREVLSATVQKEKQPNILARTLGLPFTWVGRLAGTTGRTIGGMTVIAGNSIEEILNGFGIASSELASGKFRSAGMDAVGSVAAAGKGTFDVIRTGTSGAAGLFSTTTEEIAYLVDPAGTQISSINPNEEVSIAFGCQGCQ